MRSRTYSILAFGPVSFLALLSLAIPSSARALVDYTEPEEAGRPSIQSTASRPKSTSSERSVLDRAGLDLAVSYETTEVSSAMGDGQVSLTRFAGHFQTSYDLALEADYWVGNAEGSYAEAQGMPGAGGYQKGNATAKARLKWLELGQGIERANFDIYAGLMVPEKGSLMASSRTDKIVGVETVKRFHDWAVGLGYEFRLPGTPSLAQEAAIGNVQKLAAVLGLQVSGDIRFEVEAARVNIAAYGDSSRAMRLGEKVGYGHVTPQMHLGLGRFISLDMGARFMAQRPKASGDGLARARLWGANGAYGNALFAGLGIGI